MRMICMYACQIKMPGNRSNEDYNAMGLNMQQLKERREAEKQGGTSKKDNSERNRAKDKKGLISH